ncbi:MAG: hypothetical protein QM479_01795 [Pseudomonadota bacterium]
MPYFVYKISPTIAKLIKPMEQLAKFDSYKEARNHARLLRQQAEQQEGETYKVIFAENTLDAEEKLTEIRDQPIVREWEK